MNKQPFRAAVFGMNGLGYIVCVKPPKEAEDCGLYIHVEDIEKYEKWQKQFDLESPKDGE